MYTVYKHTTPSGKVEAGTKAISTFIARLKNTAGIISSMKLLSLVSASGKAAV